MSTKPMVRVGDAWVDPFEVEMIAQPPGRSDVLVSFKSGQEIWVKLRAQQELEDIVRLLSMGDENPEPEDDEDLVECEECGKKFPWITLYHRPATGSIICQECGTGKGEVMGVEPTREELALIEARLAPQVVPGGTVDVVRQVLRAAEQYIQRRLDEVRAERDLWKHRVLDAEVLAGKRERERDAATGQRAADGLSWFGAQGNTLDHMTAWQVVETCMKALRDEADRIEQRATATALDEGRS